ncbi:sterol regulatory element binding protein cleavage-activating protein [Desarmillaria tabescens]|uniref:Sterol regulatory element binding protein cleavage-activating protein n=1 Tax=Armillaria tabescens TaxID=1929756 RepID=A0AA39KCL1_ARMTA|nr:sterol regulatory element binding protein cleavage-activating protein [Desarmillaria tabescens]KAK0458517.1 sterol regulatory element binding protein cleavage-activating protein [Desarmillaria tabescens]
MLELFIWFLAVIRSLGSRFFLRFGLHCATHQIRVILISGVVITSLLYPALDLYTSTKTQSILETLTAMKTGSGFNAQQDLVDIWSGHESLRVGGDSVSRARCGVGRTLRVERILIQSPLPEDDSALNHQILLSTLKLEDQLNELIASRKIPCLRHSDGRCFVLSPLAFWHYDQDTLLSDTNILDTLNLSKNVTVSGIPITAHTVLAGRDSEERHVGGTNFDFARYLALTYFFLEVRLCSTSISALLYLTYISFVIYVVWSMRQMNTVHSRIGVMFTGLVEITVSTITSLSVCALVGFKITMVDAVGRTHVTLPVKQRIAEGLSFAGTSNILKVVSYNTILGVIAFFAGGAIRQFCAFAIVVLVAHGFLAHTFFIAVLSIDMQRLELEELLRQDPGLAPAVPLTTPEKKHVKPRSKWQKVVNVIQSLFSGRAKKNLSLFLLLATTATLYYATLPSDIKGSPDTSTHQGAHTRVDRNTRVSDNHDPVWHLWKTFNPTESALHLRIESPTILTFRPDVDNTTTLPDHPKTHRLRFRTLKLILWLLQIMVLPIGATNLALYGLLLYLLKDAELLEAQKNRANVEEEEAVPDEAASLRNQFSFSTLPRTFSSDVELIATNKGGQVVASVGVQNEIVVWNINTQIHLSIDATDVLLSASAITCVAVDERGVIAVWGIKRGRIHAFPHLTMPSSSAGVTEIEFNNPRGGSTPPHSRPTSPVDKAAPISVVATYENGVAAKWALRPFSRANTINSLLLRVAPLDVLCAAFCLDDGTLEIQEINETDKIFMPDFTVQAGNPTDIVTKVDVCRTIMGDETRTIVGAVTEAGVVSLWDGVTGEMIRVLDEALCFSLLPRHACRHCGHLPLDSISLVFSAYLSDNNETRRCSCTPTRSLRKLSYDGLGGRRSRSGSFALSSAFEASFPVSAHGIHSRRASEKDSTRRASELTLPVEECETNHAVGPAESVRGSSKIWQSLQVVKVGETSCERGCWGVLGYRVVGVRRRPRNVGKTNKEGVPSSSHGLSLATLDRWEVWTFEPSNFEVQASALSMIADSQDTFSLSATKSAFPRLPFTRVSPLVAARSYSLAGFGNTLGVFNFLSS